MKPEETIYNSNFGTNPMYPNDSFNPADGEAPAKTGMPRLVQVGAAGAAGLAVGAVGFMLTSSAIGDEETIDAIVVDDDDEVIDDEENGGEVVIDNRVDVRGLSDGEISFATTVTDDMTFGEAFAAARGEVGAGGAFVWHGNVYGTYTAQEWNSMTPAEQQAFGSHFDWNHIDGSHQGQDHGGQTGDDNGDHGDHGQDDQGHDPNTKTGDDPNEDPNGQNGPQERQPGEDPGEDPTGSVTTATSGEEPDVEVIGIVQDNTLGMGYVEMRVDGHETYMIDQDGDGTIDVIVSDLNDNGELDPGETEDVSAAGVTLQDISTNTGLDINVIDYDEVEVDENPDEVVDDLDIDVTDDTADSDPDIDITDDQALDI